MKLVVVSLLMACLSSNLLWAGNTTSLRLDNTTLDDFRTMRKTTVCDRFYNIDANPSDLDACNDGLKLGVDGCGKMKVFFEAWTGETYDIRPCLAGAALAKSKHKNVTHSDDHSSLKRSSVFVPIHRR